MPPKPSYSYLTENQWKEKISTAFDMASHCCLCPRRCKVDRTAGETGFCKAGGEMRISSIFPHHGEEPPISGTRGSGTVFFSHCTLRCVFCQNFQISHKGEGRVYLPQELAQSMLDLSAKGCHNINLVTPSHFLPWILEALNIAAGRGLELPIVYNCGGYESSEVLGLLKNVVDIYLPDMKYGEAFNAAMYSNAPDYVPVNRAAIREMLRQAGPLKCDENGIAYRGLIIRHLVLPGNAAGSSAVMSFLKESFDPHDIHMSIMAQYRPLYRAEEYEVLNRQVLAEEYDPIREAFINEGFEGYFQEAEKLDTSFVIDFQKRKFEELTGR